MLLGCTACQLPPPGSRALSGSESFARSLDLEEAMSEASEDMGAISAEAVSRQA